MVAASVPPAIALSAAPSTATNSAIQHVVHISVDGLGSVYLRDYLDRTPQEFPSFARLRAEAAYTFNARCDFDNSLTQPNHASIFTGRPVGEQPAGVPFVAPHGFMADYDPGPPSTLHNTGNGNVPYKASVFDVAHDYGFSTAFFSAKPKLALFIRSYDAEHGALDLIGTDQGRNKMDWHEIVDYVGPAEVRQGDSNLVNIAITRLAESAPSYTFLHFADPDITGHYFLWGTEEYRAAVKEVDRQLARVLAVIDSNTAMAQRTALILTSDHGGGDVDGWHVHANDPKVYSVPMFLRGPGVTPGLDLYALFSNRTDPGGATMDYSAPAQPLRNGDTGNLSLALLGLPPIPGSTMIPALRPRLAVSQTASGLGLSWPVTQTPADLEVSDAWPGTGWVRVRESIVTENGWYRYNVPPAPTAKARFFRLITVGKP